MGLRLCPDAFVDPKIVLNVLAKPSGERAVLLLHRLGSPFHVGAPVRCLRRRRREQHASQKAFGAKRLARVAVRIEVTDLPCGAGMKLSALVRNVKRPGVAEVDVRGFRRRACTNPALCRKPMLAIRLSRSRTG